MRLVWFGFLLLCLSAPEPGMAQAPDSLKQVHLLQLKQDSLRAVRQADSIRKAWLQHRESVLRHWYFRPADSLFKQQGELQWEVMSVRKEPLPGYIFLLDILLFIYLAFFKFSYQKEFSALFLVLRNLGLNQQLYRELSGGLSFPVLLMNLFSLLSLTLYFFLLQHQFLPASHWSTPELFGLLFAGVLLLFAGRFILIRLLQFIFPFRKEIRFYYFTESQIFRLLGFCLFPILVLVPFAPGRVPWLVLIASGAMLVFFFLFRLGRGFVIGRDFFSRNKFHFFLYICALEIAPFMILIKLFFRWLY